MLIKLDIGAIKPTFASPGSVGLDLFANENLAIGAKKRALVKTGVHVAIPIGYYGRIASRSGLACKEIDIGAGVIDPDYRGELKVLVINNSDTYFNINRGDKIAQLIQEACSVEHEFVDNLDSTIRGENGFGSSGYSEF